MQLHTTGIKRSVHFDYYKLKNSKIYSIYVYG